MTTVDYAVFLVASILGLVPVDARLPWLVVGIWSLLKLLKVL